MRLNLPEVAITITVSEIHQMCYSTDSHNFINNSSTNCSGVMKINDLAHPAIYFSVCYRRICCHDNHIFAGHFSYLLAGKGYSFNPIRPGLFWSSWAWMGGGGGGFKCPPSINPKVLMQLT